MVEGSSLPHPSGLTNGIWTYSIMAITPDCPSGDRSSILRRFANSLRRDSDMTIGIYGIYDKESGDCLYVGMSSVSVERRWKQHIRHLITGTHKRKDFVNWFRGKDSDDSVLVFKILEECSPDHSELNAAEIHWFDTEKPRFFGKNPSVNEKWSHSDETLRRISMANVGKSPANLVLDPDNPRTKMDYAGGIRYLYSFECVHCGEEFHRVKESKFCSVVCCNEHKKSMSTSEYDYDFIYDLYWVQGLSRPELAVRLGVGRTKALNIMKRLGIPRRSSQEGVSLKNSKQCVVE